MNNKYEIARIATLGIFDEHELDITGLSNAMDLFAKEVAIEFANWLVETTSGAYFINNEGKWSSNDGSSPLTTSEKFKLFKTEKEL